MTEPNSVFRRRHIQLEISQKAIVDDVIDDRNEAWDLTMRYDPGMDSYMTKALQRVVIPGYNDLESTRRKNYIDVLRASQIIQLSLLLTRLLRLLQLLLLRSLKTELE
jgi:hypothetical protein